jgi:Ca2+:H+ antiporter
VRKIWITVTLVALITIGAAATHYMSAPPILAFGVATAALAGLAWIVSFSTEQVGERYGPAVTGVLQTTLGNLPEFFIVIFALRAGEAVVAQTSLLGSVFANALLVLGLTIILGARRSGDGIMRFHPRLPNDNATLMMLCSAIIATLGIAVATHDKAAQHVKSISIVGAVGLLVVYGVWLSSYLKSDHSEESHGTPKCSLAVSFGLLAFGGVLSAFASDWFVSALSPAMTKMHISKAFAGLIIVAIAGNAVENVAAFVLAWKRDNDMAISIVKNSTAQIAGFLFPALILISLLFAHTLTFSMAPIYIGALLLTAIVIWQVTGDGEATAFEGTALVVLYVVLAVITLYQ